MVNFLAKYRISTKFSLIAAMVREPEKRTSPKRANVFRNACYFFFSVLFFGGKGVLQEFHKKRHANDNPPRGQRILNFVKIWCFLPRR